MCGIVGLYWDQPNPSINLDIMFSQMLKKLYHRGPDNQKYWLAEHQQGGLGFNRLSIIDLSQNAMQPLWTVNKDVAITFNGECYNFQELKQTLNKHTSINWQSKGDAEVVLYYYYYFGIDKSLRDINGFFSLAIWDKRTIKPTIILARDRMGKKPLFYSYQNKTLLWASEIKALMCYPNFDDTPCPESESLFFMFEHIPAPYTQFKHTQKLKPGHYLQFHDNNYTIHKYWDLSFQRSKVTKKDSLIDDYHSLVHDAVKLRCQSDVPMHLFLSGGFDSTLIAHTIKQYVPSIKALVAQFPESKYDESDQATLVAKKLDIPITKIPVSAISKEDVDHIIKYLDEPFSDPAVIPLFKLCQSAKQNTTVVITGDGGDEQQAGYFYKFWGESNLQSKLPFSVRHWIIRFLMTKMKWLGPHYDFRKYLAPELDYINPQHTFHCFDFLSADQRDFAYEYINDLVNSYLKKTNNLFDFFSAYLFDYMRHCFNTKTDVSTMLNSLESRSPLMDYRLFEWVSQVPHDMFYDSSKQQGKQLIRKLLTPIMGEDYINSPKRGFSVPLQSWAKTSFPELEDLKVSCPSGHFNYKMSLSLYINQQIKKKYIK
ncbi:asparagine synthase (glutamine-hydrolyzing) [Candidatus Marinamargulisbacteria bacterium SCGC AG-410-N11]|nr:asparagine synthase (glutamine-hydrolyzing) [Candidatus Marinamargulisbacteria bacterium SCGC AG-410-N11]